MILNGYDAVGLDDELFLESGKIKTKIKNEFVFFPTLYCNFKCPYCFNLNQHPDKNYLDIEFYNGMIKDIEKMKNSKTPSIITMLGGEFFTHPKVLELLEILSDFIKINDNMVYIVTNGSLVPKYLDKIDKDITIELSFHPSQISVKRFKYIIDLLRDNGNSFLVHIVYDFKFHREIMEIMDYVNEDDIVYGYKNDSELRAFSELGPNIYMNHIKISDNKIEKMKEVDFFSIKSKFSICHQNVYMYQKYNECYQSCSYKVFTIDEIVNSKDPKPIICPKNLCSQYNDGFCQFNGNKFNPRIYKEVEFI